MHVWLTAYLRPWSCQLNQIPSSGEQHISFIPPTSRHLSSPHASATSQALSQTLITMAAALIRPGSCAFGLQRPAQHQRRAAQVCFVAKQDGAQKQQEQQEKAMGRREIMLNSVNVMVLGALLNIGAAPRPNNIGIQDYGGGVKTLALCPRSPNCIATSEEANDPTHYVPPWTYNPEDGRGRKSPVSKEQAMSELEEVVKTLKPDNFTPKVIKKTDDFLYVEYESPLLGFIDDVEFWFRPGSGSRVEYRSASRVGESDGNINRKRIKAIRQELEKKGWASVGF